MTEEKKRPKLVLVDGSNYLFRAFYAIRELSNSKGFPTNAIYGFTTMLMKLLREQAPDCIAVAFDVKAPTFRHDTYADYKATRRAVPDALIPQIPYVKEVVRGLNIPILEQAGLEADDIIGTIACRQAAQGMEVVIVSGDKDLMQLVSDNVVMTDTMKDKTYDVAAVKERFGVPPEKVVEILGLTGDVSDNIPGVPGIGPKGALRLIEQFGGIEEILAHPEKIHNLKTREAILRHADQARLSLELARIRTDAEFPFDIEACHRREPDRERLIALFREFEFSSLLQELKIGGEAAGIQRIVRTEEELEALVARLGEVREFSLDLLLSSAEAMRASLVGLALSPAPGEAYYLPVVHEDGSPQLPTAALLNALAPFLTDSQKTKHGHDLKTALVVLAECGISLAGLGCDTMVASYLLNPAKHGFELADTVLDHLGRQIPLCEGGRRERCKGSPVCHHLRGKSDRLRLPPRRCSARPCGGAFREDRCGGHGRTLRRGGDAAGDRPCRHGAQRGAPRLRASKDDVIGDRTAPLPLGGEDLPTRRGAVQHQFPQAAPGDPL